MKPSAAERLAALRTEIARRDLAAYVVPTADPHQSEYVPPAWQRRAWLTGFTGSAGTAVVTRDAALLWTDSRYWLQAEPELAGTEWSLMRAGKPDVPQPVEWLAQALRRGERAGVDPAVIPLASFREWKEKLARAGAELTAVPENLVDLVWEDRPPLPAEPVMALDVRFAGRAHPDKLAELRAALEKAGCDAHVISALDSIAWLYNVRGRDIECNPLAIAWAIVSRERAELLIDPSKVGEAVAAHLGPGVDVLPYERFGERLDALARARAKVWVDPHTTSRAVAARLAPDEGAGAVLYEEDSPILLAKAVKNEVELAGLRACHVRDGAAVCRYLAWLERELALGSALDEIAAAARLEAFRAEEEHFQGVSFPSISAYGPNGAIVHYRPLPGRCATLRPEGLYLIDSGAQYLDGTTDITRTVAVGPLTDEMRDRFTRVLRGHIAVATARFPAGTPGAPIDALARRPLWDAGLDFGHGTGHGVGHFLCVHEGPQGISVRSIKPPLRPGMIVSNEPGYYRAGQYGIRIESLVEVVDAGLGADAQPFLGFRELTLCPIDTRCVERSLLTAEERAWLDAYHARVLREITPRLRTAAEREWLARACAPV
jgi:Xaa-Pro aminopeptidase